MVYSKAVVRNTRTACETSYFVFIGVNLRILNKFFLNKLLFDQKTFSNKNKLTKIFLLEIEKKKL